MNIRPFSYSKLNQHNECPGRIRHYLDGDLQMPTEIMLQGRFAHSVYEAYARHLCDTGQQTDISAISNIAEAVCRSGKHRISYELFQRTMTELILPFAASHMFDDNKLAGIETRIAVTEDLQPCEWHDPHCWFRAVLDILILDGDTAHVVDYKAGFLTPDPGLQGAIYAWLVMAQYPHITSVTVTFDNTRFGRETEETFWRDDMPAVEKTIRALCNDLEADQTLDYAPGLHCMQCQYRHVCRASHFDVPGMIESDEGAKEAVRAISLMERDLALAKASLRAWVVAHGNVRYNGTEWGFHASTTRRVKDVDLFLERLRECGLPVGDYVSVNAAKIKTKKFMKLMGDTMNDVAEDHVNVRFAGKKQGEDEDE